MPVLLRIVSWKLWEREAMDPRQAECTPLLLQSIYLLPKSIMTKRFGTKGFI